MLINAQHCLKGPKLNGIQCTGILMQPVCELHSSSQASSTLQEVHAKMYVSKKLSIVL